MIPSTLSAALLAHRAGILKAVGHVLQVVEVDGMRLSLETCLMLAAENLDRHAKYQRHPTLTECEAAGRGPDNYPGKPFEVGGLSATKEERARFEAYMRGHCWDVGHYVDADECYDTTFVRCLFGVWRDRGALPTVWPTDELVRE